MTTCFKGFNPEAGLDWSKPMVPKLSYASESPGRLVKTPVAGLPPEFSWSGWCQRICIRWCWYFGLKTICFDSYCLSQSWWSHPPCQLLVRYRYMKQLCPMRCDKCWGLWERVSHSSIETQGRGGSFSTSGQCLWVEPLGLLQVFWYYEGSNAEDKVDALRMTKQKWCKAPGSLMMSSGHKINCGVAYLLFVKPFWVGVLCYFQSKLT